MKIFIHIVWAHYALNLCAQQLNGEYFQLTAKVFLLFIHGLILPSPVVISISSNKGGTRCNHVHI